MAQLIKGGDIRIPLGRRGMGDGKLPSTHTGLMMSINKRQHHGHNTDCVTSCVDAQKQLLNSPRPVRDASKAGKYSDREKANIYR